MDNKLKMSYSGITEKNNLYNQKKIIKLFYSVMEEVQQMRDILLQN
jgi:negative regulator of genetic competence, sporulation and motility